MAKAATSSSGAVVGPDFGDMQESDTFIEPTGRVPQAIWATPDEPAKDLFDEVLVVLQARVSSGTARPPDELVGVEVPSLCRPLAARERGLVSSLLLAESRVWGEMLGRHSL